MIEKCSESTGIIFVLYILDLFCINSQPHITDSLLAISIFFDELIIEIVGAKPAIPDMADIVISDFFKLYFSIEFITLVLFLNLFFIFL